MIIYSVYDNWLAAIDTSKKESTVTMDIDDFFDAHKTDIFVTFNGEKEKQKYPNVVIFSSHPGEDFLQYCANEGLNCETNNLHRDRACYNVTMLAERFEDIIAPRLNLYSRIISQYGLSASCLKCSLNQLTKEALRWK